MAVVKLTNSKKAVLFIDDAGNVYIVPKKSLELFITGKLEFRFLELSILPFKAEDKFKPSKLYDPHGISGKFNDGERVDGLSGRGKKITQQIVNYQDKEVDI